MVLDTSQFSVHELKAEVMRRFELKDEKVTMLVTIITFGFKYAMPYNVDLLFDVRFLPNPHFVESLRPKTGLDPEVVAYLKAQPGYDVFYDKLLDFVTYLLPEYQKEMKSYLTIGIGCTGGKHRSRRHRPAPGRRSRRARLRDRDRPPRLQAVIDGGEP